jgi:pilus assembly protein CpaC
MSPCPEPRTRRILAACLALALACWGGALSAQTPAADPPPPEVKPSAIGLEVSQGKLVVLPQPATSVFIADPAIADIQIANADHVFVFGKRPGRTSLYALGPDGVLLKSIAVEVVTGTGKAQEQVAATPSSSGIRVTNSGNGVVVGGEAANAEAAALAQRTTLANVPDKTPIDDRVKVRSSAQVTLRVRIAEVNRTITKELGINWNNAASTVAKIGTFTYGLGFTGGLAQAPIATATAGLASKPFSLLGAPTTVDANAILDALAEEQLVTILAEPTLTAISGETASFLAGGEFPIPIAEGNGAIAIQFQSYGVGLNFVPTVMSSNHINLRVRPEVSQLTTQGAVTLMSITVPALTIRRAETTIELGSGESFAIAGLLQDTSNNDVQRFPGLGDLPVLGPLFRSTSFQRGESELLIVVTPYIVRPIDDPKAVRLPTDAWQPASDVERIFNGRLADPNPLGAPPPSAGSSGAAVPHLVGAAGFEIE